ncbi:MAG TPA: hypothetical protein VFZ23_18095 [Pyrinomonadaceae bacterium]
MQRLREEFDADRIERGRPTYYPLKTNRWEAACSVCGRSLYVDDDTKQYLERMIELDLESKLTCPECEAEYDVLAFG